VVDGLGAGAVDPDRGVCAVVGIDDSPLSQAATTKASELNIANKTGTERFKLFSLLDRQRKKFKSRQHPSLVTSCSMAVSY
jgi:hypothetical protein